MDSLFLTLGFCFALLLSVDVYMVYINGYVHVHMFVGGCACVQACGGVELASDIFLDHCPFYLRRQGLLLSLELTDSAHPALQLALGILPLPPGCWVLGGPLCPTAFMVYW